LSLFVKITNLLDVIYILYAQNQSSRSLRSNDYRSGICMVVIEIGRREYRMVSPRSIPLTVTTDSLVRVSAKLENKLSRHGGNGRPPPNSNFVSLPIMPTMPPFDYMISKRMRDIDRIPRWIEAEERKLRREWNEDFVAPRQSHHEEIDKKKILII